MSTRRRAIHPWTWLVIALCVLGLYLRVVYAGTDLSTPHIDENDVIDQAVAFMGGDWHFYLLEYGPLPMYALAGIYHLLALVHGVSPLVYAARVFFDYEEQYFVGRLFCIACAGMLAWCCHRVLAARFGRWTAGISASLLALPTLEVLTSSKTRIDIPQGAFQVGALLCLVVAIDSPRLRHWVFAGICAGFAIACKPMPGLLVLPCFLAASWFIADAHAARGLARRCLATVTRPGLWLGSASTLVAAIIGNPTCIDLARFIDGQRRAIAKYSGSHAPGLHLSSFEALGRLGTGFLLVAALCTLAMLLVRDARARLIALFPLIYALAFWGRPVRRYYCVAPAMALCLVIGLVIGQLMQRSGLDRRAEQPVARWWTLAGVLGFLVAINAAPMLSLASENQGLSPGSLARQWIFENIPSHTRLYHFGPFEDGPLLVADDPALQESWGNYFDYGRNKYEFLHRAFRLAYADYVKQKRPAYQLEVADVRAEPLASRRTPAWLTRSLDQHARQEHEQYIVVGRVGAATPVLSLGYRWFKNVELVREFGYVAIFRVPPAASESERNVAVSAPSGGPSSRP